MSAPEQLQHQELHVDNANSKIDPTVLNILLRELSSSSDKVKADLCSALSKTGIEDIDIAKDMCGKGKNSVTKNYLATNLLNTVRLVDRVCAVVQPAMTQFVTRATDNTDTQSIHTLIKKVENLTEKVCTAESTRFAYIEKQLSDLHGVLGEINLPHHPSPNTPRPPTSTPLPRTPVTNPTACYEEYLLDYVTLDDAEKLTVFLDKETFADKNGRYVAAYGVPYHYTGSHSTANSRTMPELIKKLVDKVNQDREGAAINSIVVNRYTGPESFLPEHQDNETSIRAGSDIITVSLGRRANLSFRNCLDRTDEQHIEIRSCSMYAMSQSSQSYWTHRIDADPSAADDSVRYSITMRSISKHNKNSTVVLGDSNTRFLDGENKHRCGFNSTMPGRRIPTYHIREIDPTKCIGYQNVIVHVGINSLNEYSKGRLVTDFAPNDVDSHVNHLINKLEEIRCLSPRARIIVSPILPTKLAELNERAVNFNRQLINYVKGSKGDVKLLNFNSFVCGRTGLLDQQFSSYMRPRNPLHLGSEGIRKLGTMFRDSIFRRYVDGRSYSNVATPRPRVSAWDFPSLTRDE